ncbi:MAG: sigma-54-dependent Fis family transcriptional regulator [Deltaproteobacteria bacterium]|nr:MAG: sigma-54-dependent Fis family transcriptional regulator [Deltaproteobacteria bacterium]
MRKTPVGPPDRPVVNFYGIVTASPEMMELFELVKKVARTEAPVLVRGQTGAGKELFARAIHRLSGRASGPFQAINCATLSASMLASELFGHVKGAFTGAIRSRPGLFRLADGGTIFLDEIAEMPLDIQAQLLRVLQDKTFTPLGGTESIQVDVRIVSATHRALRSAVQAKAFREDLMYRIRVVPIYLPALAERTHDVEALTWHFIREMNRRGGRQIERIGPGAMEALLEHPWPGNVRELQNVIAYAYAVGEGHILTCGELPPELRGESPPDELSRPVAVDDNERRRIVEALTWANGKKGDAAERLGMSRTTLWRKMRELRID